MYQNWRNDPDGNKYKNQYSGEVREDLLRSLMALNTYCGEVKIWKETIHIHYVAPNEKVLENIFLISPQNHML